MNQNNITSALHTAFTTTKEVIGVLQCDPDYSVQADALAEVLDHLRTVDREIPLVLLREADIAQAECRKDHDLPAPDLDGPVQLERPAKMNFTLPWILAQYVWGFCQRHHCKPGAYFRLLVEKDMRLTREKEQQT